VLGGSAYAQPEVQSQQQLHQFKGRLACPRRLAAERLTNGAVARRLYISPHTVNTHLRHVFAKLGVPNRVALAAVAHHSIG
jgi:DNA-binding NarL/FixJ family response regulator